MQLHLEQVENGVLVQDVSERGRGSVEADCRVGGDSHYA